MSEAQPGGPRFQVHCSPIVAQALRRLQRQASRAGKGKRLTRAFRQTVELLQEDPFEVGEPLYRLPALRMQIRCVVNRPLVLDFAVCEDRPLVFIKGAEMLS